MEDLKRKEKSWYVKHRFVESNECYISGPLDHFRANLAIVLMMGVVRLRNEGKIIEIEKDPVYIEEGDIPTIIEKEESSEDDVKMYLLKKSDNN